MINLEAKENMLNLAMNPYPGRGIIVGLDQTDKNIVQIYWIMGRSENSRNRVFSCDCDNRVFTEAANPAKVKDPSLIIYNAMREISFIGDNYLSVVSNGTQTDAIITQHQGLRKNYLPFNIVHWGYEPDAPNFTPRITAVSMWEKYAIRETQIFQISILRKSQWSDACDRHFYEIDGIGPGYGYGVTTYHGDGDPLPSFRGEPKLFPFVGDIDMIANSYWAALNKKNRVSLAVKFIPKSGPSHVVIVNKYKKKV